MFTTTLYVSGSKRSLGIDCGEEPILKRFTKYPVTLPDQVIKIICAAYATVAILNDGTVWCVGEVNLFIENQSKVDHFIRIPNLNDCIDICCPHCEAVLYAIYVHSDHSLSCSGSFLSVDAEPLHKFPSPPLEKNDHISKVVCGQHFIAVLTHSSQIWIAQRVSNMCFSDSTFDHTYDSNPYWKKVDIEGHLKIVDIGAGIGHVAILTDQGFVVSFGKNRFGCLGTDSAMEDIVPPQLIVTHFHSDIRFKKIFVKTYHMFLQACDGSIYAVGYQKAGRLGQHFGTQDYISEPHLLTLEEVHNPITHIHGAVPGLITTCMNEIYCTGSAYHKYYGVEDVDCIKIVDTSMMKERNDKRYTMQVASGFNNAVIFFSAYLSLRNVRFMHLLLSAQRTERFSDTVIKL